MTGSLDAEVIFHAPFRRVRVIFHAIVSIVKHFIVRRRNISGTLKSYGSTQLTATQAQHPSGKTAQFCMLHWHSVYSVTLEGNELNGVPPSYSDNAINVF